MRIRLTLVACGRPARPRSARVVAPPGAPRDHARFVPDFAISGPGQGLSRRAYAEVGLFSTG